MAELGRYTKATVLDSPAATYIAPQKLTLDNSEHRSSTTRTSRPGLQTRCSQQSSDDEDTAITPVQLRT